MAFRYESLEVWSLALEYVDACFIVADRLPQTVQFSIGDQLRRAATSIVANIAEGAGKATARSERNFYDIARGSVAETIGLLALCHRRGYLSADWHQRLYNRANVISAMLWGLIKANDSDKIKDGAPIYQANNDLLDDILADLASPQGEASPLGDVAQSRPTESPLGEWDVASLPLSSAASSPHATSPLLIVGLSGAGAESLPAPLIARIHAADLLMGGQRHLSYFPDFKGETWAITADVEAVVKRLRQALADEEQVVVLASGDPLCYGIGATLRRYFPAEALEIVPAPTAFQLAFAALAEPWAEAALLSAHARPLSAVVAGALAAPKAAILTDHQHTPAVIAQALLAAGLPPASPCAICENLGSRDQRVIRTELGRVAEESYAPLNVLVVWQGDGEARREDAVLSPHRSSPPRLTASPPGLPDDAFSTAAAQITKREVRLLTLAELALESGQILWDIGAGSGAVSIEAARAQPAATVYAIEKRAEMCRHFQENLSRFPSPNICWLEGSAPEAIHDWPDPHAVFIGGSDKKLPEIVALAQQRLHPGGRLVINLATLENLQTARALLPQARLVHVQINRAVPILDMLRFEALNPIFMMTWRKGGGEEA